MPLTSKGEKILKAMHEQLRSGKGKAEVLLEREPGRIADVHDSPEDPGAIRDDELPPKLDAQTMPRQIQDARPEYLTPLKPQDWEDSPEEPVAIDQANELRMHAG